MLLRTDKSFALHSQEEHHKDSTPLEKIDIGLVSNVPLDYMHLTFRQPAFKNVSKYLNTMILWGLFPCKSFLMDRIYGSTKRVFQKVPCQLSGG